MGCETAHRDAVVGEETLRTAGTEVDTVQPDLRLRLVIVRAHPSYRAQGSRQEAPNPQEKVRRTMFGASASGGAPGPPAASRARFGQRGLKARWPRTPSPRRGTGRGDCETRAARACRASSPSPSERDGGRWEVMIGSAISTEPIGIPCAFAHRTKPPSSMACCARTRRGCATVAKRTNIAAPRPARGTATFKERGRTVLLRIRTDRFPTPAARARTSLPRSRSHRAHQRHRHHLAGRTWPMTSRTPARGSRTR